MGGRCEKYIFTYRGKRTHRAMPVSRTRSFSYRVGITNTMIYPKPRGPLVDL